MIRLENINARVIAEAKFMIKTRLATRAIAKEFGVSRTTTCNDLTIRLKEIDPVLYSEVNKIIQINKQERSSRGGQTVKRKYKNLAGSGTLT